jgi:hypothetical protein
MCTLKTWVLLKKKKGFVPKTKENYFLGPPTVVPGPQTDEIALK